MQGKSQNKDFLGDFDFSRTDKCFSIKIPSYSMVDGVVLYEIVLKDLITNEVHVCRYRFKELKAIHDELVDLKFVLPSFPKTHFWIKTNKSPELIEQRRLRLQNYIGHMINDPYLRGNKQIKKIIKMFRQSKEEYKPRLTCLILKKNESQKETRSCSLSKSEQKLIHVDQWRKIHKNHTMQN